MINNQISNIISKNKSIPSSPNIDTLLPGYLDECKKMSQSLNWSKILQNKFETLHINTDVLDALPAYYKNSIIPQHLKQILMEEIISTVTKSTNIYFINKNKVDEDKYYSINQRKEYHSDLASISSDCDND